MDGAGAGCIGTDHPKWVRSALRRATEIAGSGPVTPRSSTSAGVSSRQSIAEVSSSQTVQQGLSSWTA